MGGLPTSRTVNGFAANPADSKLMYVATRDGLFWSSDAGETWTTAGKGLLKRLAAVAINPKRPTELYVATLEGLIYRSPDGGRAWEARR